jgi:VanZ family protein
MPLSPSWRRWYVRVLPAYWIFLFCATHLPRLKTGGPPQSDKVLHVVAFSLLAFLYWRCCEAACRKLGGRFVWTASAILIAYAGLDEYLQQFVARGSDWEDFAADVVGIVMTLAILEWQRRRAASISEATGAETRGS